MGPQTKSKPKRVCVSLHWVFYATKIGEKGCFITINQVFGKFSPRPQTEGSDPERITPCPSQPKSIMVLFGIVLGVTGHRDLRLAMDCFLWEIGIGNLCFLTHIYIYVYMCIHIYMYVCVCFAQIFLNKPIWRCYQSIMFLW